MSVMQNEALTAASVTELTADKDKGASTIVVAQVGSGSAVASLDGVSLFDMAKPVVIPQEELDRLWKWNMGLAIWHILYALFFFLGSVLAPSSVSMN
jgi:hypothetical protein